MLRPIWFLYGIYIFIGMIRNFRIKWLRVSLRVICTWDFVRNMTINESSRNLINGIIMGENISPIINHRCLNSIIRENRLMKCYISWISWNYDFLECISKWTIFLKLFLYSKQRLRDSDVNKGPIVGWACLWRSFA